MARAATVAAIAPLAVTGLPAVAAAAENSPPSRPLVSDLSTGHRGCVAGPDRPYVGALPRLGAVLHDPDVMPSTTVRLAAQFEVSWKETDGTRQVRTIGPGVRSSSGSTFQAAVPSDVPAHTVVGWRVRAHDGTEWGPWSSSGGQHPCEFVHDDDRPAAPTVSSPDYPEDSSRQDGVGVYGRFTFTASDDDVVAYQYSFMGGTYRTVQAPGPGEPVTVDLLPRTTGSTSLRVEAVDRAGNPSPPVTYEFTVRGGRAPVAHWKLADPAGSGEAAADSGAHPAAAGDGVGFGVSAPSGTSLISAAALDGSAGAYLAPGTTAVDTTRPFAVGVWVRPESLDRDLVAVGQDGTSGGGPFTLGLDADGAEGGTGAAWSLELPTASGPVRVSGGSPAAGHWTHLAAVHDPVARTAVLYVNGRPADTAEEVPAAGATGALQIGRALTGDGGATGHWHGSLADVRVWDRIVLTDEFTALAARAAARTGYWQLNEERDGATPEHGGGQELTLGGGASVFRSACAPDDLFCDSEPPLIGTGHLRLDGDGDHASTQAPPVATDGSFSLTARVRPVEDSPSRDMAVLSLPGDRANALVVRHSADTGRWELAVSHADDADAETTTVDSYARPDPSIGVHLAVVYDASGGVVRLYADGRLETATAEADLPAARTWAATGGLQVGRALTADGWGEYLHGDVDEVRAYTGALTESQVSMLSMHTELPDL